MSKRKAGVNDIIYELDNEDVELSSEDEGKEAKINRLEPPETNKFSENSIINLDNSIEVINLDCSTEGDCEIVSPKNVHNGGKTSPDIQQESCAEMTIETKKNEVVKKPTDSKTTIFNEDIVIDSPASNSDLGVVGCENRTPLITVRFRDKKMAKLYKEKVKAFMLSLIKLHDEESLVGSETETDLELDIWPEDLIDDDIVEQKVEEDNLFFVDTDPCNVAWDEVPRYSQVMYHKFLLSFPF